MHNSYPQPAAPTPRDTPILATSLNQNDAIISDLLQMAHSLHAAHARLMNPTPSKVDSKNAAVAEAVSTIEGRIQTQGRLLGMVHDTLREALNKFDRDI